MDSTLTPRENNKPTRSNWVLQGGRRCDVMLRVWSTTTVILKLPPNASKGPVGGRKLRSFPEI